MTFGIKLFNSSGSVRLAETTRLLRILGVATVAVPSGSGLYLVGIGTISGVEWTCVGITVNTTLTSISSAFKYNATTLGFLRTGSTLTHTVYIIGF